MIIGIPDKVLVKWLADKDYIKPSDEGEAIGIGAGYYLATGKPATVFMSADGFMNALSPITSFIIPEGIEMNLVISIGRTEQQHYIATQLVSKIIEELKKYETAKIHYEFIRKE